MSVSKNYMYNVLLIISNTIFPIITFPYVSRILMPEYLGKVYFVQGVVAYFIILSVLGAPNYGIRELSKAKSIGDWDEFKKIFSELLFKKNIGMEKIYYYYYFIKIAKLRGIDLTKDKTIKNIIPELRKNLQKGYEEIANKEGNWKLNSYMYCEFIDLLEKVIDTKIVWENIDYIKDDVKRNLISEILDSQNIIKKYSYIKYIRLLPKDILKKNIDILLKKVQTPIGVLTENNRVKYVANLQLALILYENGYLVQSNKILERVIYFYNNSHAKDNITTEKIFLYIENIYYRGI